MKFISFHFIGNLLSFFIAYINIRLTDLIVSIKNKNKKNWYFFVKFLPSVQIDKYFFIRSVTSHTENVIFYYYIKDQFCWYKKLVNLKINVNPQISES